MQTILTIATILSFTPYQIKTETFTIGYLTGSQRGPGDLEYPKPGRTISGAISLAVEEINKGLLGEMGHKLDFIVAETYGEEVNSVQKTADLWTQNVSVYVGPQETCQHEAFMAAAFNLPMISYFCTHHATSDKKKFPTFARTRPPDTQISKSVASTLLAFNWKHVVLLYLKSPDFEFGNVAKIVLQNLHSHGINVFATKFWTTPFHHGYGENPFYKLVKETYRDTRIYVIIGHHYDHFGLMLAMENMKLFDKGEYFVLGVDLDQYDNKFPQKYLRGLLNEEKNLLAQKAYRNYIGVVPSNPVGYDNFTTLVNTYMEQPPFSYPNPLHYVGGVKKIRAEAAYLYDAVHLYSKALISALQNGTDPRNGTAIINFIKGTHYKSAMGYIVYMDENGDAEGNYTLIARKRLFHEKDEYGLFPVGVFALRSTTSKLPKLFMKSHIDWVAGKPPIAVPFCGFRGEKCITHTVEIASGVTGGIFLIFTIISLVLYRNWKYEQELDSLIWKVDFKDIQINEEPKNSSSTHLGAKATRSLHPLIRTSQVSLSSNPDADFRYSTIFTQIGIYKGRVFAVKKVNKKSIDISRDMKKELKMIRDLRHDNLNAFIGACTDPPNICIITEYCTRGSLKDILENENVKLDNMFIASLVGDILRGMIYLHDSPVRFHGALHTANCLVDSRWVVKISDFGLREFKKGSLPDHQLQNNETSNRIKDKSYKLLYRAPELLRLDSFQKTEIVPRGTSKGDIYSFGIILYELHSRHGPFGECKLSHAEILNRVIDSNQNGHPFRPPLESLENSFDFVRDCLKECWMENPDDRPEFKCIRAKLRPLRKGMKPNIFDNMMAMMEKYANNLEVLVDERTDQLQEEKKKTEALLYEMLPRSVAEQLKRGNKVEAESFDCVTIYFSDIVGFTSMSAESTPLQVVDFLNDLYTCFDSIIENYDVYKVETIGDAYMVVSGLPIKSDNEHAAEVASMSLHLLSAVQKFTIRHRPKEKLLLRIGIHSGPVCAGVVGLKMPRYCLFGDTVNTASRMESTGTPLKIHCSKQCRDLLTQIGGYHVIERGIIEMKGKGGQKTFWLVGEDAAQKQKRNEERQKRRQNINKALSNGKIDNGNYLLTRSSLKNKNTIVRSPLQRCNSFESPKRLRFANGEHLEQTLLEVITDSPCKKSANSLIEHSLDCSEAFRTSSTSCPCIENLANSAATLAQSQLSMLTRDDRRNSKSKATAVKPSYNSVPVLFPNLSVPKHPVIHTLSAPSSPRNKPDFFDLNLAQFPECEEVMPMWTGDSMPLLKVTKPPSSESCI